MRYFVEETIKRPGAPIDWAAGPHKPIRTDGRPIIEWPVNRPVEAGRRRVFGAGDEGIDECYPGDPVRDVFGRRPDRSK